MDRINEKVVEKRQAEGEIGDSYNIRVFETSAKNANSVDVAFKYLLREIVGKEELRGKIREEDRRASGHIRLENYQKKKH